MSVLFLDIDGVLCTPLSVRLSWLLRRPMERQLFDPIALVLLRRLVRRTGARIVLSSSWRYSMADSDPMMQAIAEHFYRTLNANRTPVAELAPMLGLSKGEEIAAWLAEHPGVVYAILDDRTDEFSATPQLRPRLVLVDGMRGLRPVDYRQALALLGRRPIAPCL